MTSEYFGMKPPGMTPEIFAPGIFTTEERSHSPLVFSPNIKEVYFSINHQSPEGVYFQPMYVMKQKKQVWQDRERAFDIDYRTSPGFFTPSGNRFYFSSKRPLTQGLSEQSSMDVWMVEKTLSGWSDPKHVSGDVNSSTSDYVFSISKNNEVFLSSSRDGNSDIYSAQYDNGRFSDLKRLPSIINSSSYETAPLIAHDGSYLLFFRNVTQDEEYVLSLMMSTRDKAGEWTQPVDISKRLSLKADDLMFASLSPDGKYLFILDGGNYYWVDATVINLIIKEIS